MSSPSKSYVVIVMTNGQPDLTPMSDADRELLLRLVSDAAALILGHVDPKEIKPQFERNLKDFASRNRLARSENDVLTADRSVSTWRSYLKLRAKLA